MLVFDLHRHLAAGLYIRHRGGEEIGPLPFHQARLLALGPGLHVGGLGLLLFVDLALEGAAAGDHPHVVHRGIPGQGKDVEPLDPLAAGVLETLAHAHPGDGACHPDIHLAAEHRARHQRILLVRPQ